MILANDWDSMLRGALFILALFAVLLFGLWAGPGMRARGWPMRTLILGATVLLIYILAGQVKAFTQHIAFDGFSLIGLVGGAIFDTGLVLVMRAQRRHERG